MIRSFGQIDRDYKGYDISQGLQAVVELAGAVSRPQDDRVLF